MTQTVVSAIFDNPAAAGAAVEELRRAGVTNAAMSIIARDDTAHGDYDAPGDQDHVTVHEHKGKGASAVKGALGGAAIGALLGVAALAIPGVGPLVAAGAIASTAIPEAAAIGAGAGALAGGLGGLLKKHGVSDADVDYYEKRIDTGGVFLSVDTGQTSLGGDEIVAILYASGGHNTSRPATT